MKPPKSRKSRLYRFMGIPGGLTAETALARADQNLEAHHTTALAQIDATITAMSEVLAQPHDDVRAAQDRLYTKAYEIAGMAALFNLTALGLAAQSLCELIDNSRPRQVWDEAGFAIHFGAIRLLRRPEHAVGSAEAEILRGLARIVKREDRPV